MLTCPPRNSVRPRKNSVAFRPRSPGKAQPKPKAQPKNSVGSHRNSVRSHREYPPWTRLWYSFSWSCASCHRSTSPGHVTCHVPMWSCHHVTWPGHVTWPCHHCKPIHAGSPTGSKQQRARRLEAQSQQEAGESFSQAPTKQPEKQQFLR